MRLSNHHILVTGGAKGLGAAIVRDAVLAGAKVSIVDVGNFSDFESAYDGFVVRFGNVTGIVNNLSIRSHTDPTDMTDEEWDAIFAINLKSIWYTAKLALPAMRAANSGSIVNIRARRALPTDPSFFPYGAASEAAMGLTRNLGVDEGHHNIRANMVTHGPSVPTCEIAKTVTFLLSDDASFVNCSDWVIDGESISIPA